MKREDVPVEQDSLDNPVWHQNFDLKGVPADEHDMGSSIPAVRILGGGLDFLHGIEHDLLDWAKHVAKDGQEPDELPEWIRKNLPYRMNKIEDTSDANPAASFLCQTFTIPAATTPAAPTLVSARYDRTRIVLLNTGANPAYFGHQDDSNTASPNNAEMDWALLPINGTLQRELRARGKVYIFSPLGTVVDIQEEYGYADRPMYQ